MSKFDHPSYKKRTLEPISFHESFTISDRCSEDVETESFKSCLKDALIGIVTDQKFINEWLSEQAKKMELGRYVLLSNGEEKSGGRYRQSILADAYEAIIGAIYIDGGLEAVRQFIRKHLLKDIDSLLTGKFHHNYKSWLLEYVQAKGESIPEYHVILEKGPDHHKEFTVEVIYNNKALGKGVGPNKKKAEQRLHVKLLRN